MPGLWITCIFCFLGSFGICDLKSNLYNLIFGISKDLPGQGCGITTVANILHAIYAVVLKATIDPEGIAVLATASKVEDVVTMTDADGGDEGGVHCLSFRCMYLLNHRGLTVE